MMPYCKCPSSQIFSRKVFFTFKQSNGPGSIKTEVGSATLPPKDILEWPNSQFHLLCRIYKYMAEVSTGRVKFLCILAFGNYKPVRWNIQKKYDLSMNNSTVCLGSSDPFYIASYYLKWVTNYWTHSTYRFCHWANCSAGPHLETSFSLVSPKPWFLL